MTLAEAEADTRFEQFKTCDFMTLLQYILRCESFLAKGEDAEVREMMEGAQLIRNSRMGQKA